MAGYAFLVGRLVDNQKLQRAIRIARRWGAAPHEVMFALAWVTREQYALALATHLGVGLIAATDVTPAATTVVPAAAYRPDELARIVAFEARLGRAVLLVVDEGLDGRLGAFPAPERALEEATAGLKRRRPGQSAALGLWPWQVLALVSLIGMLLGGAIIMPDATLGALFALITVPFVLVTTLRLLAMWQLLSSRRPGRSAAAARMPDALLPVYTVLVPLFRERAVLPQLVKSLAALDWPHDKLEILLVLEASDAGTRERVGNFVLPANMRVVVVPEGAPRTKPRALNFALCYARGDLVVVYDAEDLPEADQLRRAFDRLRADPERCGCVQARLNIYNAYAGWLPAHFTMEYSALYDGLLPMLERLDLPMPLGGTSNHFPRRLLESLGAWDPYNVTEDADLGLRLSRRGWRVAMIDSTTWEEAPVGFTNWRNQRTRWLKGWMQTMLVHTRRPMRLLQELGDLRFLGLVAFLGGLVVTALVHPIFYLLLLYEYWNERWLELPSSVIGMSIWGLATFNLLVGYAVAMLLGIVAALRRGRWLLTLYGVLLPFYWLAISLAAYRALWQLVRDPFVWEKTAHRGRTTRPKAEPRPKRQAAGGD